MNEIQKIFEKEDNLKIAIEVVLDEMGTGFTMQSKKIQEKILLSIGKYHQKMKNNE